MPHLITIPIGIVVAREEFGEAWQDVRWRPVRVFFQAPPQNGAWRELQRGDGFMHYHAATLLLELRSNETMSYQVNLANGEPSVYIVMRDAEESDRPPVEPYIVTASPFEAQAHGESGFERVDRVAMPEDLIELVESFIKEHHVELPFKRRKRKDHSGDLSSAAAEKPLFELGDEPDDKNAKKIKSDD